MRNSTVAGRRTGKQAGRWLLLAWLWLVSPVARLAAQAGPLDVVATPGFRPRTIQQHRFSFRIAVDTAAGGLVARDVTIGAFTFAGLVRVDGIAPLARAIEPAGYADTVRFAPDGRDVLRVADRAARGPLSVELRGVAGSNAGRLIIDAAGWPFNRVLLITLDPLDLYVTATRAGDGTRDRLRVDEVRSYAFVSDSAARPAVVVIGMGPGARGRVQDELSSIVLERDFGGQIGRERRTVNRVVFMVEPTRDAAGNAHAELVFGLGRSEDEAVQAALGGSITPPAVTLFRVTTPVPEVALALGHLTGAAAWTDGPRPGLDLADPASLLGGAELWRQITDDARRLINREYGRPDSVVRETARLTTRLIWGLFGVEEQADRVVVAPRLDGAADDFTWRLEGYRLRDDSLRMEYRPADRRATITIGALRRSRVELHFPWLTANACVMVRRGPDQPEVLQLVMLASSGGYVDIRGAFDPAQLTVSALGCGG